RLVDRYARWNALLELLTESGRVSVEDAAVRLDVSQATIRRDFDQLAQQQMITRTRGGAVANGVSYDLPLRYKTAKHSAEKQRIGTAAASLVAPGMVVAINGGTTTTEVARALAVRPDLGPAAHHEGEAAINSLMVARAKKVVIIADSSKLGGHAFARICPIERVNTLVTDAGATDEQVNDFEHVGVTVLRV